MRITATAAFSPSLDADGLAEVVQSRVEKYARSVRREITKGQSNWSIDDFEEYLPELRDETEKELSQAAIFELKVQEIDCDLMPSRIHTEGNRSYGEEFECFFSPSGRQRMESEPIPSSVAQFYLVLLVYRWVPSDALQGDYGRVPLPVPRRAPRWVWRAIGSRLVNC